MMSKTLAVQMRFVRKINVESLLNMRSLMVMLCILSISVLAKDENSGDLGIGKNIRRRKQWAPEGSTRRKFFGWFNPRHKHRTAKTFEEDKKRPFRYLKSVVTSFSGICSLVLFAAILTALCYTTNEGYTICNDTGASAITRIAVIIPGSILLVGGLITSLRRDAIMTSTEDYKEYNKQVASSKYAVNTLGATTIAMIVSLLLVIILAGVSGSFGKTQTVMVIGFLLSASVTGAWFYRKYNASTNYIIENLNEDAADQAIVTVEKEGNNDPSTSGSRNGFGSDGAQIRRRLLRATRL